MRLVIESGNQPGRTVNLEKDIISIGRGMENDVMISDSIVSRRHCQIRRGENGWAIADLNSVNGTRVNGQRITAPSLLRAGDLITLGQTNLRVEEAGKPTTLPSAQPVTAQVPQALPAPISSNVGLWIGLGVTVLGLFCVGILAVVWISTPTAIPTIAIPSPTVALAAVSSLTATPSATPSVSAIVAATVTPVVSPTGMTITQMPGGERTRTPIPTISPTGTPTKIFPVPKLEKPAAGTVVTDSAQVVFNWEAVDVLRPEDLYLLEISANSSDFASAAIACTVYTRETFIAVANKDPKCNDRWQFNPNFHYSWRVQVVAPGVDGKYLPLHSETVVPFDFFWAP